MPKGRTLKTKGKDMDPITLTEREWREILSATGLLVLSYTEAINDRVNMLRIEIDTDDAMALKKNTDDMVTSMTKIGAKGKITAGSDMGYEVLAIMLDSVEVYHTINAKHFPACDCQKCDRLEKDYRLAKRMIGVLAGANIADL